MFSEDAIVYECKVLKLFELLNNIVQESPDRMSELIRNILMNPSYLNNINRALAEELVTNRLLLKAILDNGGDVNSTDETGCTATDNIVDTTECPETYYERRSALEMLIFENPDINVHNRSVEGAITTNLEVYMQNETEILPLIHMFNGIINKHYSESFLMAGTEHPLYEAVFFAWNFVAPLLLEWSFPVADDV